MFYQLKVEQVKKLCQQNLLLKKNWQYLQSSKHRHINRFCINSNFKRQKLTVVSDIENIFTLYMTEVVTTLINDITTLEIRKPKGLWIRVVDLFCS